MPDYTEFFLNRAGSVIMLECLEFSHPSFSKTYYAVRNAPDGVTVTHEDGSSHLYEYVPLKIDRGNTTDDLDQKINIMLADLGRILPPEVDAVLSGPDAHIAPKLKYRAYRHDDLSQPLISLQVLDVTGLSRDTDGLTSFEAKAPELNNSRTGNIYSLDRFPLLRGVL